MAESTMEKRVEKILLSQKRKPITMRMLAKEAKVKKTELKKLRELLEAMVADGSLVETKNSYVLSRNLGYLVGEIVKVTEKFGFARVQGMEKDLFLPGRTMLGAMPGDIVLLKPIPSRGELPEGEVVKLLQAGNYRFTGVLIRERGRYFIQPDKGSRMPMELGSPERKGACEGDKVLAEISERGTRHFQHRARIVQGFGSASSAANCCEAILAAHEVAQEFSEEALEQARMLEEKGIHPKELDNRTDLRRELIFTIDGADSKDLDDAVSIEKTAEGWKLGVHIADVSYYVGMGSAIDKEAYERATSIYYVNKVIPMLPKELSNGICSLNPGEDRLAFSALMELDKEGKLVKYRFEKTVIRSVVKGVYTEINQLLAGTASQEIEEKYALVREKLLLMKELADILSRNRFARGGMELESVESKIVVDSQDRPVEILPRERGESERIIEEFMLTANTACACFGLELNIPFIFRVHEEPPSEKLGRLTDLLEQMGLSTFGLEHQPTQHKLAQVLAQVQGTPLEKMVNNQILRTMAKAEYSHKNIGHYGLVLKNYTHFTSPIRRYPDLIAHRELTLMVTGGNKEKLCRRYEKYLPDACDHATGREIRAMQIERECDDCYKAEYMLAHVGETFDGIISSVTSFGIYVELSNTVEGLVRVDDLPPGEYIFDEKVQLLERFSGQRYRVGDPVRVLVTGADVGGGKVDFVLADI